MGKKQIVCRCGGSFDEKGICTECGKKRQRSTGYRVFHSILIVIASLIVLFCLSMTLSVRHYVRYHNISGGMKNARLSDFVIPGTDGQTVTEYIRRNFVTDERVLPEDIAGAVDATDITGYLAGKAEQMGKMLSGETDTYPTFSADEVIKLLENSEDTLYSKCMLVIEEKDKADLRKELEEPFADLNNAMEFLYGSKAGRALARFRISIARVIIDLVLLGLLLWRWIKVRKNSGKAGYGAVRGMGWVFFVPSVLVLIFCIVTALQMAFKSDDIVSIYTMIKGIRMPHWLLAPLTAAFGILLMAFAGYIRGQVRYKAERKNAIGAAQQAAPAAPALPAETPASAQPAETQPAAPVRPVENAVQPAAPVQATVQAPVQPAPVQTAPPVAAASPAVRTAPAAPVETTPTTAKPAASVKNCVSCGKEIPQSASFCIYCGTSQKIKLAKEREAEIETILRETAPAEPMPEEMPIPEFSEEVQSIYGSETGADISAQNESPMRAGLESYLKKMNSENGDTAE